MNLADFNYTSFFYFIERRQVTIFYNRIETDNYNFIFFFMERNNHDFIYGQNLSNSDKNKRKLMLLWVHQ